MERVLVRQYPGRFVTGYIHAEKNQDIEVENDETHWVGHDFRRIWNNQKVLSEGFRLTLPAESIGEVSSLRARTETVDNNETVFAGDRSESIRLRALLQPGMRLPCLHLTSSRSPSIGLRVEGVSVERVGFLSDGGKWASVRAQGIIAILIG